MVPFRTLLALIPKKAQPFNNTHLPKHHYLISCQKAQSDGLQWVTISYYEQSDIINQNIVTHRNSSKLIVTHKTTIPKHHNPISWEKS